MYAPKPTTIKSDQDTAGASTTTHAALPERRWRVLKVLASYSSSTQAGTVTIAGLTGGTVVVDFVGRVDIPFGDGVRADANTPLVVTVSPGAAAVVSNLTTIAYPE